MGKKFGILVIFLSLLAIAYFSLRKNQNSQEQLTLYGNVDIRDVALGFRVPGRVQTLKYDEGDRVQKGAVLAILDQDTYTTNLSLSKAELAAANASFEYSNREYIRQKNQSIQKINSQKEYENAESQFHVDQAKVEEAKARLEQTQISFNDTELLSPEDGIILTRITEPGSIVAIGAPVYTLALNNPVWIRTYVNEPNLGNIYPGQKAIITTDSGTSYQGQVGFISPQAEFTPKMVETTELRTSLVYRLRVIVNNPNSGLRQGMPVTITLLSDHKK